MEISVNKKYIVLQSVYWSIYCVAFVFATYYLQGNGIAAGMVGVITAVAGILSAVVQPSLGKLTDSGKASWKSILLVLTVIYIATNGLLLVVGSKMIKAIFFGLFLAAISCFSPITNGVSFYYENRGEKVNFGFARGMGSLFYAVLAYVLGFVTVAYGTNSVPAMGLGAGVLLLIVVISMQCERPKSAVSNPEESSSPNGISARQFVAKYRGFMIVVIGCTFILSFHNMICNYMINIMESVGGNSANMGTAIAISGVLELPAMFLFSRIVKRFKVSTLLVFAAGCFVLRSVVYLFATSVVMIYAAQTLQAVSFAVIIPASVYFAEQAMGDEDKMKGQAYMGMTMTVGSVIGSLLGGNLIQYMGVTAALYCGVAFAVAGAIFVVWGIRYKDVRSFSTDNMK